MKPGSVARQPKLLTLQIQQNRVFATHTHFFYGCLGYWRFHTPVVWSPGWLCTSLQHHWWLAECLIFWLPYLHRYICDEDKKSDPFTAFSSDALFVMLSHRTAVSCTEGLQVAKDWQCGSVSGSYLAISLASSTTYRGLQVAEDRQCERMSTSCWCAHCVTKTGQLCMQQLLHAFVTELFYFEG